MRAFLKMPPRKRKEWDFVRERESPTIPRLGCGSASSAPSDRRPSHARASVELGGPS